MPKNLYNSKVILFLLKRFFVLAFLFIYYFYPQVILAASNSDTMLGYWKFDGNGADFSGDGSTVTAIVGTGSGYDTTNTVNRAPTAFLNNGSLKLFPFSNVYFANQTGLRYSSDTTFSFWIKLNAYPTAVTPIGGNFDSEATEGYFFEINNTGNISFATGSGNLIARATYNTPLVSGRWYHILGIWNHLSMQTNIYVDGTLGASVPSEVTPTYNYASFQIGHFDGNIDEVRLYKRVLSSTEISDLAAGYHTSAIWNGSSSFDYENSTNWNINAVPDPYTLVNIPNSAEVNFSADSANYPAEAMAGLTIGSGAILNLLNTNLTINDNGTFSNDGILELYNGPNQLLYNFVNDTNSGAVKISAPASTLGLITGNTYNDLIINATGDINVKMSSDIIINGNLNLQGGIFDVSASNYGISLAGNWINSDRSLGNRFNPRSGTVTFNGANQTITGKNIFFNLTKSTSNPQTLTFEAGSTQVVINNLTLQGAGSASNFLYLRSTVPSTPGDVGVGTLGEQWYINSDPTKTFASGLDIMDSNKTGGSLVLPGRNKDSGNNTGWIFDATPPSITINNPDNAVTSDVSKSITGSVSDLTTYVTAVKFQLDSEAGTWSSCTADDGTFNSSPEAFTCIPIATLSEGTHTVFIRALDANGNASLSSLVRLMIDVTPPELTPINSIIDQVATSTPSYTFNSTEAGAISYFGDCASPTLNAVAGDNTVIFNSLTEGLHSNCALQVSDIAGNQSEKMQIPPFTVKLPFAISSILVSEGDNFANISWLTVNNPSSSIVDYGITSAYDKSTPEADVDAGVTNHTVSISGLASCTTYYYRVRSKDASSNEVIGPDSTFKTSGCIDACSGKTPDEPNLNEAESTGADSIKIYYDDVDGEVGHYELKYGLSEDNYEWSVDDIGGKDDGVYTIKLLKPDTTYYFKIRAINDCGKGDWSDSISGTTDQESINDSSPILVSDTDSLPAVSPVEEVVAPVKSLNSTQPPTYSNSDTPIVSEEGRLENPEDFEKAIESSAPISDEYLVSEVELIKSEAGDKIKLSGKGPANETLTIYIYSDPIVLTVKTDSDGNWSYILDKNIEDGKHEIYVTVTGSDGKILEKSRPIAFVKTAEATTILPSTEADAADRSQSPTQLWYKNSIFYFVLMAMVGLLAAVILIGFYKHKTNKELEGINV